MAGPDPASPAPPRAAKAADNGPDARAPEPAVVFYCAACGACLAAPITAKGGTLPCPQCLRAAPVPEQPLLPAEAPHPESWFEKHRILSLQMRFLCPVCDSKLAVDARAGGARSDCPQCGNELTVPQLPGLVPKPAAAATGPPRTTATATEPSAALSPAEIQFLTAVSQDPANV